ncbi:hypothetical protein [Paenibacillus crassostreae]|uniref:hypothetical protein n=1 Tax=Paenibacillus crassostreae TaxID=1763538 RepID=UPI00139058AC|nr:hypothetical protein [Paenibacillus crassostreae]
MNKDISNLYLEEGFDEVWIPDLHNNFLNENEYTYHKTILISQGIPENRIKPIKAQHKNEKGRDRVISEIGKISEILERHNEILADSEML